MIRRSLLTLGALALLAVAVHVARAADPVLATEGEPKFTFPATGSSGHTFDFFLFSTGAEVKGVTVETRQVKNPDGQLLPSSAVKPSLKSDAVGPQGVAVTLELAPQHFQAPGEYKVILTFKGSDAASVLNSTVVITHPAADINLEELKDRTFRLTRAFPGLAFDHTASLTLRETTGKSDLAGLQFVGQDILRGGTKETAAGRLTVTPVASGTPRAGANVPPGTVACELKFSGLDQAGTFDTGVVVRSAGFGGEKVIPLKLSVADFILWPLLAISLGVLGAYLVRRIAHADTPRDLNQLRILRLRGEVDRFRGMVRRAESISAVEGLLEQLERAEEANGLGNFAAATAELTQVESALDTFRKSQATLEDAAQKSLAATRREVAALAADAPPPSADETRELEAVNRRLDDAERMLRQGQADDAGLQLEGAKLLLDGLTRRRLSARLSQLVEELAQIETASDGQKGQAETLTSSVREHLSEGEFGKARTKLSELKILIDSLKVGRRRARGSEDNEGEAVPTPPAAPEQTRIRVDTAVEQRIANTEIAFTLVDAQGLIMQGDVLRWHFGDIGSFEVARMGAAHRYRRAGRYQVRVEVMRDDAPFKTLEETVTILPGQGEINRALVIGRLRRNERILSAIALVIAVVMGVLLLYVDKPFGTLSDYLLAVLWGFGIDNSVKSVADVFGRIKASGSGE